MATWQCDVMGQLWLTEDMLARGVRCASSASWVQPCPSVHNAKKGQTSVREMTLAMAAAAEVRSSVSMLETEYPGHVESIRFSA